MFQKKGGKMRKIFKIYSFAALTVLLIFFTACQKGDNVRGHLVEVKRMTLEGGGDFNRLYAWEEGYAGIDWSDASLKIFNKDGKLLDWYSKEGSGPGEYNKNRVQLMGVDKNRIYLAALDKSTVLAFEVGSGKILFRDEYPVNEGSLRGGAVDPDGHIWLALQGGAYDVAELSPEGEILKLYLPAEEKERAMSPEKLIKSMKWIAFRGNKAVFISFMTYELHFYSRDEKGLHLITEMIPRPVYVENNYEIKTSGNSISMTGRPGISGYAISGETLFVKLLTDSETARKEKNRVHAFSLDGEGKGLFECRLEKGETLRNLAGVSPEGHVLAFFETEESASDTVLCELEVRK